MSIFPTRILLATDGSEEAELATRTAADLAEGIGSGLHAMVNGESFALEPGRLVFVPKGCLRATRSASGEFVYLSVHRRRGPVRLAPRGGMGDEIGGQRVTGRRSSTG
jgi:hypothetical protein